MAINYQEQVWVDGTDTYTPLTADRMNHMEAGIKAACDGWDSVSQRTTVTKTATINVSPQSSSTASINTGIPRNKLPIISGWEQGSWELSVHRVKLVEKEGQMQAQISLYNPLSKSMTSNITVFIDHMVMP